MNNKKCDVALITETHSIAERVGWYEQYVETAGFHIKWSHKTTHSAGIAVITRKTFMTQFSEVRYHTVRDGHCMVMRARTANGQGLDIYACYMPADYAGKRKRLMSKIVRNMNVRSHNMVIGDFNFTHKGGDRFHFDHNPPRWADPGDPEAEHWSEIFANTHYLHEIYQPRMTFHNSRWASRIDRVYSSLRAGRLAALQARAYVLENVSWSDHKPVGFCIAAATRQGYGGPTWLLGHSVHPHFPPW